MKIAHISDLHLTTFFSVNNLKNIELVLQYINDIKVDHTVVTGDLTDNADPKDFILLRNLFDKYNLLYPEKLSLVIGNHDIYGGVQTAEDIFAFPEKCRIMNYKEKVNDFYNFFPEAFADNSYLSDENIFPYAKVINDVLIVGLNSVAEYSRINNPFASNGKVELKQFIELAEILENHRICKHKIILVHHHFNKIKTTPQKFSSSFWQNIEKQTMKLRKKKRLLYLFNQFKIDLVLHGHYHESGEYYRKEIRFSNAGASFKGFLNNELNINIISITNRNIELEIHKLQSSDDTIMPAYANKKLISDKVISSAAAMN